MKNLDELATDVVGGVLRLSKQAGEITLAAHRKPADRPSPTILSEMVASAHLSAALVMRDLERIEERLQEEGG